jgi:hypothetical protein
MRFLFLGAATVAALLSTSAYASVSSGSVTTRAHYNFGITTTSVDNYNGPDFSQNVIGTGKYTALPYGTGSFGGGTNSGGGDGTVGWDGTISAPPQSSVQMNIALGPILDAGGARLAIFEFSNPTEFDAPTRVHMAYDFNTSGSTSGNAGVEVIDAIVFELYCTSCSGLPTNFFTESDAMFAGDFYGAGSGAFGGSGTNSWDLSLTLHPFSSATFFATISSSVTMTARGPAVPEPSTWALMIFGAGAVGVAARRRRKLAQA